MNTGKPFNKYFDHTLLKPEASPEAIEKLCNEAREHGFYSVCVNSSYAGLASEILAGSDVKVCCVVGFPLGAGSTDAKVAEAISACQLGASEIDMVIHVGMLKAGLDGYVRDDIAAVVNAAREHEAIVKVILETCLLTDDEIVRACNAAKAAGASFVKTSTGFSTGGAKTKDVILMKSTAGNDMQVKASGGIRTLADAISMIESGADRIGASASVAIMEEYEGKKKGRKGKEGRKGRIKLY